MRQILKYIYKALVFYSPKTVKQKLQSIAAEAEVKRGCQTAKKHKVAKAQIEQILQSMDLSGDIMLHTSITNIGKIQGGARHICESLLANIDTTRQTLLVSALPYRGTFYEYLNESPVFDVRTAPIAMGTVNERLAACAGAERSLHPTHSVVALGPKAHYYTADHHRDTTPFGPNSPYAKFLHRGGKILLIGATLNNITAVHALEDELSQNFPKDIYADRIFDVRCVDRNGNPLVVSTKCHHPIKCIRRDMERMRKYLTANGAIQEWQCGGGYITLIDAQRFVASFCQMMLRGENIYGKHVVTDSLVRAINRLMASYAL